MDEKILKLDGEIMKIKINGVRGWWADLHFNKRTYYFKKENSEFLKKYNLKPTIFNLNCLKMLKGVILTESQILKINNLKGGLK